MNLLKILDTMCDCYDNNDINITIDIYNTELTIYSGSLKWFRDFAKEHEHFSKVFAKEKCINEIYNLSSWTIVEILVDYRLDEEDIPVYNKSKRLIIV